MTASTYMTSWISAGGEWIQVSDLYADTANRKAAEMWLMAYDRRGGEYHAEKPAFCACGCGNLS